MAGAQTIDTNIKILSKIADNTRLTMNVVSDFKNSVSSQMNAVTNGLSNLGKSLSQTFSLSSLGSKIGETFNKGFNSFTAPFKTLSSHISAAFTGLKMKLANLNPVEAVKEKILKFMGEESGNGYAYSEQDIYEQMRRIICKYE